MGGITSTPSGEDNSIDFEAEDFEDTVGDKLIFLRLVISDKRYHRKELSLRNAIIQLHGQFLHFKHVQKFRNRKSDSDTDTDKLIAEELKMMKVLIMVIYKGIEELKADKEVTRIEDISDVISRLILEFDEFKVGILIQIQILEILNPFRIPT